MRREAVIAEEMRDIPRADEPVPEWALRGLDAKGRNLLKLLCPGFHAGDVADLTRENLDGRHGYGKSSVDAVMALVEACRDGSVWTPTGIFAVHANEFDSLSDMLLKTVEGAFPLNDACRTVMRVYLGFLDATERATLEETGKVMHVTRERVRQIGKKILDALNTTPLTVGLSDLVDWAKSFFESHGMEAPESEFVDAVAMEFSWAKPTPFSLRRVLDELGFKTEDNPLTRLVAWNKDGAYDWVRTYKPPTVTERRRTAIKAVLQEAGPGGLTPEEILVACKAKFPDVDIGVGNVNGCRNLGNDLDDNGTRMIGLLRGKRGEAGTHYTLNTFFHDDETKSVLQKAGDEVKEYIERTGFGVVDVWKIWCKYKDKLPREKPLPKLGFYMMMRDIGAGGLCYKDYPRISYKGMDVCENAYWWELYEYFHYCGHKTASFSQIMSFFVDCLGIQPDIALSCAFTSMGLEKEEEATDAQYVIRRPPAPKDAPMMLLRTTKKDEELSLIKTDGKFTIHSDYFDEDGHAIYHPTYVKVFLRELEKKGGGFSDEEIFQLTDAGWCKVHLKILRPMLKRVGAVKQEKGKGYWLEEFKFGDANYYACCDWHQANKSAFDVWAAKKAKDVGVEFVPYEIGVGCGTDVAEEDDEELPSTMPGNDMQAFSAENGNLNAQCVNAQCELGGVMNMTVKCPCCQNSLEFAEETIGAKVRCHHCGEMFYVDARVAPREHRIAALRVRAQDGDKWSQCELGRCYENGDGVAADPVKAANWYRKAAEQGFGLAQYKLAICYAVGRGIERDRRKSIEFYRMAAEKGVLDAQLGLARYYEDSINGEPDYNEAAKWYGKAAKQGNAEAQYELAKYYMTGKGGVPIDVLAAVELYHASANAGYEYAYLPLVDCYMTGNGVEKDVVKAALLYVKIEESGLLNGLLLELGREHRGLGVFSRAESEEIRDVLKWARMVAKNDDADGMYHLGACYATGKIVERNEEEALKWYLKAAEEGSVDAQREYGECLLFGRGVEKNCEEACKWLQQAADAGDHIAQIDMCYLCAHGIGCEENETTADEWLSKAAESISKNFDGISEDDELEEDDSKDADSEEIVEEVVEEVVESESDEASEEELVEEAKKAFEDNRWEEAIELARKTGPEDADLQSWMGNSYEFGYGVEKDLDESFRWHKAAAENGDGWSQYKLGDFFEHGKGTDKNLEEAFKWYKAASGQEIVQAQYRLGVCYEFGKGTAQNLIEAFNLFKVAAEKDYASAQYFLGFCCESGRGTDVDIENARKWYKKAADAGDREAKEALARLDEQQEDVDVTEEESAEPNDPISQSQEVQVQKVQGRVAKMRKPSKRKAYDEMAEHAAEIIIEKYGIDVGEMNNVDDYLYCLDVSDGVDEEKLMDAANKFFHGICVLEEGRELTLDEEAEYCTVHYNEHSGKYFILFNHPFVIEAKASGIDVGETVREFSETQRGQIAEEESEDDEDDDADVSANGELTPAQMMKYIADGIKSGAISSKSGEGYFVLKGEYFDAIKAGRKTTEYRDLTPRNLSKSIGIKTVKLQRGYGHPGQPPEQMRYEVASVGLLDADDHECDPYNIPDGFIATTIAIHLGKRIG